MVIPHRQDSDPAAALLVDRITRRARRLAEAGFVCVGAHPEAKTCVHVEYDWPDPAVAGMDTYCVVLGTGKSVYGGIDRWAVDRPGHGMLVLTAEAAEALGTNFDSFEIDAGPSN
jgi:hypothetical protein